MKHKAVIIPTSMEELPYIIDIKGYDDYLYYIGCRSIDLLILDEEDGIEVSCYVDDEGILNGSQVNEYFLRAYKKSLIPQVLSGKCVIECTDSEDGEAAELNIQLVKNTLVKYYGFLECELKDVR